MVINDAFLVTLFQILTETPEMTATEVIERTREKGALLSPPWAAAIRIPRPDDRARSRFAHATKAHLPDARHPAASRGRVRRRIRFAPLTRKRRKGFPDSSGLVDWSRDYVQITGDKRPLDFLDWDAAMPEIAQGQAVPTDGLKPSTP